MIRKELQESFLEVYEEENANLNDEVKNVKSLNEGIQQLKSIKIF